MIYSSGTGNRRMWKNWNTRTRLEVFPTPRKFLPARCYMVVAHVLYFQSRQFGMRVAIIKNRRSGAQKGRSLKKLSAREFYGAPRLHFGQKRNKKQIRRWLMASLVVSNQASVSFSFRSTPARRSRPATVSSFMRDASKSTRTVCSFSLNFTLRIPYTSRRLSTARNSSALGCRP